MNNKSVSPSQNFAAEVTKLGAGDEIRRFDGIDSDLFQSSMEGKIFPYRKKIS